MSLSKFPIVKVLSVQGSTNEARLVCICPDILPVIGCPIEGAKIPELLLHRFKSVTFSLLPTTSLCQKGEGFMDDETLVAQAQQTRGKPNEAYAELYRRNLNRIYRYVLIQVGDVSDAEDITAQTFLSALNSLKSYRGGGFTAWLFGIARMS
jgi:hypothetical protein